jgi:hypothetical protein
VDGLPHGSFFKAKSSSRKRLNQNRMVRSLADPSAHATWILRAVSAALLPVGTRIQKALEFSQYPPFLFKLNNKNN